MPARWRADRVTDARLSRFGYPLHPGASCAATSGHRAVTFRSAGLDSLHVARVANDATALFFHRQVQASGILS